MDYAPGAAVVARIAAEVLKRGLPRGSFLSVNVPAAAIKGIKVVPHSLKAGTNAYDRRETPRHELYFWNVWTEPVDPGSATDVGAITDGYVAVTPLRIDANDDAARKAIEAWPLR
jgi:5'-nucleotidase